MSNSSTSFPRVKMVCEADGEEAITINLENVNVEVEHRINTFTDEFGRGHSSAAGAPLAKITGIIVQGDTSAMLGAITGAPIIKKERKKKEPEITPDTSERPPVFGSF